MIALTPAAAAGSGITFAAAGVIVAVWANGLVSEQNELLKEQNKRIQTQNQLMEASRRSALVFELTAILDKIDEHLSVQQEAMSDVPEGGWTVPSRIYGRIAGLSRSLQPYRYLNVTPPLHTSIVKNNWDLVTLEDPEPWPGAQMALREELTEFALSPERGQLLIAIHGAGIDLSPLWKLSPSFEGADLREAELSHAQLSTAHLRLANLASASLKNANLSSANLTTADLKMADLTEVDLRNASLHGANLWSSKLLITDVRKLSGCDFTSASLVSCEVTNADFLHSVESLDMPPKGVTTSEWRIGSYLDPQTKLRRYVLDRRRTSESSWIYDKSWRYEN